MGWVPLLEGKVAEDAWRVVRGICDEITERVGPESRSPTDLVLLRAYAARVLADDETARRYDLAGDALVARIEQGFDSLALHGGLTGAGWLLAHLHADADELLDTVDQTLIEALSKPWRGHFDLIQGLVGFGVYFLERLDRNASAALGIERVVDQLVAISRTNDDGTTWHTRVDLLPIWKREHHPDGYFDCGVAHGVPGVIALLSRIAALPDPPARAAESCASALRWLRARQLSEDPAGRFPSTVRLDGVAIDRARTAWCYGDLGISRALWVAADRIGEPTDEWRTLALDCAARAPELCRIEDAGLCHGAVGMAHVLNRCYQASGDPIFRDSARRWIERTLAMRKQGEGVFGFTAVIPRPHGSPVVEPSADLLPGASGIALALIAALCDQEPAWDRLLLLA